MVDYTRAIKRPFQDFKDLSIGALMFMIPFVSIITGFFGMGQWMKCCRKASKGKFELPEWDGFGKLFLDGILSVVIGLIYFIPFIVIMFLVAATFLGDMFTLITTGVSNFSNVSIGTGAILWMVIGLLTIYITPLAITYFAVNRKFEYAFKFKRIFKHAFTGKYFAAWLFAVVYSLIISAIVQILSAITSFTVVLPFVIAGYGAFITGVTLYTIYGEAYSELNS